jgi:putative MATE family efflux protein
MLNKIYSYRRIYSLALPAMGSFILNTLYSINDFFWSGRLGSAAVEALGLVMMVLIFNAGLMALSQKGILSSVARLRGMLNFKGIRLAATQGILLNFFLSTIFAATGWIASPFILEAMGGEGEVLQLAVKYLRLIYLGFPLMSLAMAMDGIFFGLGDTKTPFRLQLLGVSLNTILNAASVLLLGAGLTGIALASILSRGLMALVGAIIISSKKELATSSEIESKLKKYHFPKLDELKPRFKMWLEFLRIGLPVCTSITLYASIFMVLNRILSQFGQEAFGVVGIGIRGVESIGFMVLLGFGAASATLVGELLGKQVSEIHNGSTSISISSLSVKCLKAALPITIVFSLLWFFIPETLCRVYTNDLTLIEMSSTYLRFAAIANLFQLVEIVLQESMVGAGVSTKPLMISLPGNLLRIPLAIILVEFTALGINAIWMAILISSILKSLGMLLVFKYSAWQDLAERKARRLHQIAV